MTSLKIASFAGRLMIGMMLAAGPVMAGSLSDQDLKQIKKLEQTALTSNLAYQIDQSLSTEVGARRLGTAGNRRSITWAVAKMKQLGFDKVWTEKVTHQGSWIRGTATARILSPYPQKMVAIALGGSIGTPKAGLRAEVVEFKDFAALQAAAPGSLTGKIAFVSFRMKRKIDGSGYHSAVKSRVKGPSVAAEKGALALIIRSVGTDNNRLGHTGMLDYKAKVARIPAAALSNPDADMLSQQIATGKPVKVLLKLTAKRRDNVVVTTANVIGEITGSTDPNDYVVMGAHLDSWDVGTGAMDDGIGVGVTLAAAHYIASLPKRPHRTIRVILFAAEEEGLVGVKQYVKTHKNELKHHVIGAEWDFGTGRIYQMIPGVGPSALNNIRALAKLLAPLGVSLSPKNNAVGQSDMSALGEAGMPALDFSPNGLNYFDYHHTENDTLDKVNAKAMKQNTAVFTIFSYFAAESGIDFRK